MEQPVVKISKAKMRRFEKMIVESLTTHFEYRGKENDHLLVVDKQTKNYLLIYHEWREGVYYHNIVLHLGILASGKIGVYVCNMEVDIAQELVSKGINKQDIILLMQPIELRCLTGYGV